MQKTTATSSNKTEFSITSQTDDFVGNNQGVYSSFLLHSDK